MVQFWWPIDSSHLTQPFDKLAIHYFSHNFLNLSWTAVWKSLKLSCFRKHNCANSEKQSPCNISPTRQCESNKSVSHSSLENFGFNLTNENKAWNRNELLIFKLDSQLEMLLRSLRSLIIHYILVCSWWASVFSDVALMKLESQQRFLYLKKIMNWRKKCKIFLLLFISRIC